MPRRRPIGPRESRVPSSFRRGSGHDDVLRTPAHYFLQIDASRSYVYRLVPYRMCIQKTSWAFQHGRWTTGATAGLLECSSEAVIVKVQGEGFSTQHSNCQLVLNNLLQFSPLPCENCGRYNHLPTVCQNSPQRKNCGRKHESRSCMERTKHCANCGGAHHFSSPRCRF